jgi:hypothetical protein
MTRSVCPNPARTKSPPVTGERITENPALHGQMGSRSKSAHVNPARLRSDWSSHPVSVAALVGIMDRRHGIRMFTMRDDLLDAQAAVDWAAPQIPLLQQGFLDWQRRNPYRVVQERDTDTGQDVAVTYDQPFPLTFNAWAGSIINSLRSGLDLLAASLAARNSVKPSHKTHFPIFSITS